MTTNEAAQRLATERDRTAARIAEIADELSAMDTATAGSNQDDEHDPEGVTLAFEREQLTAVGAQLRDHLADIEAALARVADGTYGVCESCGEAIAAERLAALPATRRCVRCAARQSH